MRHFRLEKISFGEKLLLVFVVQVNLVHGMYVSGQSKDERLDSGYEAVPTRDIHMNQVGLEKQWLHFLAKYIAPLNYKVYTGYQDEVRSSSSPRFDELEMYLRKTIKIIISLTLRIRREITTLDRLLFVLESRSRNAHVVLTRLGGRGT